MTDTMLPIIRQMHDAVDDRARALVLLAVPDRVLMQYRTVFEAACERAGFRSGLSFIGWRRASWSAVRGPDGLIAKPEFDDVRRLFAAFAAGRTGDPLAHTDDPAHGEPAPSTPEGRS